MVDMLDESHGFKEWSIVNADKCLGAERKNGVYMINQAKPSLDQESTRPLFKEGTFFVKSNWKKGGE